MSRKKFSTENKHQKILSSCLHRSLHLTWCSTLYNNLLLYLYYSSDSLLILLLERCATLITTQDHDDLPYRLLLPLYLLLWLSVVFTCNNVNIPLLLLLLLVVFFNHLPFLKSSSAKKKGAAQR